TASPSAAACGGKKTREACTTCCGDEKLAAPYTAAVDKCTCAEATSKCTAERAKPYCATGTSDITVDESCNPCQPDSDRSDAEGKNACDAARKCPALRKCWTYSKRQNLPSEGAAGPNDTPPSNDSKSK